VITRTWLALAGGIAVVSAVAAIVVVVATRGCLPDVAWAVDS
jgi:hypothetical protein